MCVQSPLPTTPVPGCRKRGCCPAGHCKGFCWLLRIPPPPLPFVLPRRLVRRALRLIGWLGRSLERAYQWARPMVLDSNRAAEVGDGKHSTNNSSSDLN